MIDFSGKPTIQPFLYYSGKIAGYLAWLIFCLILLQLGFKRYHAFFYSGVITLLFLISGFLLIILSSVNLGNSIRIGLPEEGTQLKTGGIYRYTRNPMYVGFHMVTLSAMIYSLNPWIIFPGLYSFYVYHLIILGEEKFLKERFGEVYVIYKQKVNRYL
jgi:protein-S-isoprenylcysteine O-methyltransferase Ste14